MTGNKSLQTDPSPSDILPSILNGSPFKIRPNNEKLEILKLGRPLPKLDIFKRDTAKGCNRTFQMSWYNIHKWLCASQSYNKLFCWPCVLMRPETSSWCSTGNDDLKRFPSLAGKHAVCKSHLKAIAEYDSTLRTLGLPPEYNNESKHKFKDEEQFSNNSNNSETDSLDFNFETVSGSKSSEKLDTVSEGMEEPSDDILLASKLPSNVRAKITFKTWQDLNKDSASPDSSIEKFFEDQKLFKWKRRVARQELKNARLAEEKLKLEIEVLRAKAEYYKLLKADSVDSTSSVVSVIPIPPT